MSLKAGRCRTGLFIIVFFTLMTILPFPAAAAEFNDGAIRLVLHEETGRFTIYSLHHRVRRRPVALFFAQDPRTSFLSVMVNDRVFRMGDSQAFRTRIGGTECSPSLIFESYFMQVTKEFSFVRTASSAETNGVAIRITLENRGDRQVAAGARFLLDTNLGDRQPDISFTTNRRTINAETVLTRADRDSFWIDRNDRLSLTGSLFTGSDGDPDRVHFANWKRLSDASLRLPYQPGRNFNMLPYSVRDSAVSYYFEPRPLGRGEQRTFGFYLFLNSEGEGLHPPALVATNGEALLDLPARAPAGLLALADLMDHREYNLAAIRELMARIDTLISSGTATEEELAAIELAMNILRARYASGYSVR